MCVCVCVCVFILIIYIYIYVHLLFVQENPEASVLTFIFIRQIPATDVVHP